MGREGYHDIPDAGTGASGWGGGQWTSGIVESHVERRHRASNGEASWCLRPTCEPPWLRAVYAESCHQWTHGRLVCCEPSCVIWDVVWLMDWLWSQRILASYRNYNRNLSSKGISKGGSLYFCIVHNICFFLQHNLPRYIWVFVARRIISFNLLRYMQKSQNIR